MAWCVQPRALPDHPPHTGTILVTYNFASGTQGPAHPAPGRPYYAVGFPRHSLLPDTPLGRRVLVGLRGAWERRALFTVRGSRTTGREHVVAWAPAEPPRSERAHYAAGGADAARHLRRLLAALHPHPPPPRSPLYQELA